MEFITSKSVIEEFIDGLTDEQVSASKKKAIKKRLASIAPEPDCQVNWRQIQDIFEGVTALKEQFLQQV
jgi:hypothetical protein